jgi:hypothetical protein
MFEGVLGVLAFFVSSLAQVAAIAGIGVSLATHRTRRAWKIGRLAIVWLFGYGVILLLVSFTSQPRTILLGQERCFDEMCYSVQAVSSTPALTIASGVLPAQGKFLVLTLRLRSDAKRTAQHPSEPSLFILDADGRQYPQFLDAESGQPLSARQLWAQPVPPGGALTRKVAFDLAVDVRQPGLVMSEGLGPISGLVIGDENSPFHARTVFALSH